MPNKIHVQNPFLNQLLAENQTVMTGVAELFANYSPAQLTWKPDPKSWSMLECIHHLVMTMSVYYPALKDVIDGLRLRNQVRRGPFRPTWFGKIFIGFVLPKSRRKIKTVRAFQPAAGDFSNVNVKDLFLEIAGKYNELIVLADGYDLNGKKFTSPASRWVRLTPGEGLWLHVAHNRRHLQQAQDLARHPDFPPNTP